jgi:hypothetical protein
LVKHKYKLVIGRQKYHVANQFTGNQSTQEQMYNVPRWFWLLPLIILVGIGGLNFHGHIVNTYHRIRGHDTMVLGNGPKLLIMTHGWLGSPADFHEILHLFNQTKYTIFIPFVPQLSTGSLETARDQLMVMVNEHFHNWRDFESVSFFGMSLGGILAKMVVVHLKVLWHPLELETFVTVSTPHDGFECGLFMSILLSFIPQPTVLHELYRYGHTLERANAVMHYRAHWFSNGLNYMSSTYDDMVPIESSSLGLWDYSQLNTSNGIYEHDVHTQLGSWKFVFVPMTGTLRRHGNMIGKHVNNPFITWDREPALKSMQHIASNFK